MRTNEDAITMRLTALLCVGAQVCLFGLVGCKTARAPNDRLSAPAPVAPDTGKHTGTAIVVSEPEAERFGGPENATGVRLGNLQHLVYEFEQAHARLPDGIEEVLSSAARRNPGVRVDFTILREDLWGRRVLYRRTGAAYEVRSAGADGAFDTPDDILVSGVPGREMPCFALVGSRVVEFGEVKPPCPRVNP